MYSTLFFVILYYNIDNIIKKCYMPLFIDVNVHDCDTISNYVYFFFSLKTTSIFMIVLLYLYQLFNYLS